MAIIQTYSIYEYINSTINLSKNSMQKKLHTLMLMEMYSLQFVNGLLGEHEFCILYGILGSSVKAGQDVLQQRPVGATASSIVELSLRQQCKGCPNVIFHCEEGELSSISKSNQKIGLSKS